jgi:hypothetical protein
LPDAAGPIGFPIAVTLEWRQLARTGPSLALSKQMQSLQSRLSTSRCLLKVENGAAEIQISAPIPDISDSEPTVCQEALPSIKGALTISCCSPPNQ